MSKVKHSSFKWIFSVFTFLALIAGMIVPGQIKAADVVIESYDNTTNSYSEITVLGSKEYCQTFTASVTGEIQYIEGKFRYTSLNIPLLAKVELYAVDGSHKPTGSVLSTGYFELLITAPSFTTMVAGMTNYTVIESTEYALVYSCAGNDFPLRIATVTPGDYGDGQSFYSMDSGVTWWDTTRDIVFTVYGDYEPYTSYEAEVDTGDAYYSDGLWYLTGTITNPGNLYNTTVHVGFNVGLAPNEWFSEEVSNGATFYLDKTTNLTKTVNIFKNFLEPGTTYYYQFYLYNDDGFITEGDIESFTYEIEDKVTFEVVDNITEDSAIVYFRVLSMGGDSTYDLNLEYGLTDALGSSILVKDDSTETGWFYQELTGLTPNTLYFFKFSYTGDVEGEYETNVYNFSTNRSQSQGNTGYDTIASAEDDGYTHRDINNTVWYCQEWMAEETGIVECIQGTYFFDGSSELIIEFYNSDDDGKPIGNVMSEGSCSGSGWVYDARIDVDDFKVQKGCTYVLFYKSNSANDCVIYADSTPSGSLNLYSYNVSTETYTYNSANLGYLILGTYTTAYIQTLEVNIDDNNNVFFNGSVNNLGDCDYLDVYFRYGYTVDLEKGEYPVSASARVRVVKQPEKVSILADIVLSNKKIYFVQMYGVDNDGITYEGGIVNFQYGSRPIIEDLGVSNISYNEADFEVSIVTMGIDVTANLSLQMSKLTSFEEGDNYIVNSNLNRPEVISYKCKGLDDGTKYYYRWVYNGSETGEIVTSINVFTTFDRNKPEVSNIIIIFMGKLGIDGDAVGFIFLLFFALIFVLCGVYLIYKKKYGLAVIAMVVGIAAALGFIIVMKLVDIWVLVGISIVVAVIIVSFVGKKVFGNG